MRRQPPKVPRPTPVPRVSGRLDLPDRAAVDRWWPDAVLPLVEPTDDPALVDVTFCWRDAEAEQVLLFANRLTDETHLADTLLERLPGTDLWHATYRMGADWRASYSFLVRRPGERAPWLATTADGADQVALRAALDRGHADPRNPDTCRNRAGVVQSVVSGPLAPAQPWLAPRPDVTPGTLTELVGPGRRTVWLHEPAGSDPARPMPLLVVLDGEVWAGTQSLPTTLDNLLADGEVPPLRAVFVDSGGREARWADLGADGAATEYVARHLVPWVAGKRGVLPREVGVMGQSLGGLTALRLGLRHPDVVRHVISHSASLWQDDLTSDVAAAGPGVRVHLGHGSQEWVLTDLHHDLARRLRAAGIEVDAVEHNGGHDYAWWRGAVADGIRWAFG